MVITMTSYFEFYTHVPPFKIGRGAEHIKESARISPSLLLIRAAAQIRLYHIKQRTQAIAKWKNISQHVNKWPHTKIRKHKIEMSECDGSQ